MVREHPPQTPNELLDTYESCAKVLPRPWRWWYVRKVKRARQDFDARRNAALRAALQSDSQNEALEHVSLGEEVA